MGVIDQGGHDRIIACIHGEIDSGRTVYVHCWGGKGRMCTAVECLLIDGGLDYDGAIARIAENGRALARRANPVRSRRRSIASCGSERLGWGFSPLKSPLVSTHRARPSIARVAASPPIDPWRCVDVDVLTDWHAELRRSGLLGTTFRALRMLREAKAERAGVSVLVHSSAAGPAQNSRPISG
jgi:hypothetical protein